MFGEWGPRPPGVTLYTNRLSQTKTPARPHHQSAHTPYHHYTSRVTLPSQVIPYFQFGLTQVRTNKQKNPKKCAKGPNVLFSSRDLRSSKQTNMLRPLLKKIAIAKQNLIGKKIKKVCRISKNNTAYSIYKSVSQLIH